MNKVVKKNKISSITVAKNKHKDFVQSRQESIKIGEDIFTRDNAKSKFSSLSDEEKEKITVLQLNNLYYLLNNYYLSYISKKSDILRLIDDFIHFDNRSEALIKYKL